MFNEMIDTWQEDGYLYLNMSCLAEQCHPNRFLNVASPNASSWTVYYRPTLLNVDSLSLDMEFSFQHVHI